MNEEKITKAILKWLIDNGWEIVCFDFPQSGTGIILHINGYNEEKNKNSIIPDIVAVKNGICIFLENKDRFYYPDFEKQHLLKKSNDYSNSISDLLNRYTVDNIFYGIGIPTEKHKQRSKESSHLVDFIICVDNDESVHIVYNPANILFLK